MKKKKGINRVFTTGNWQLSGIKDRTIDHTYIPLEQKASSTPNTTDNAWNKQHHATTTITSRDSGTFLRNVFYSTFPRDRLAIKSTQIISIWKEGSTIDTWCGWLPRYRRLAGTRARTALRDSTEFCQLATCRSAAMNEFSEDSIAKGRELIDGLKLMAMYLYQETA